MRSIYSLAWWLGLPLVLTRLLWRARKEPGYRRHIAERLGFYAACSRPSRHTIWIHAVSVGETRAAEPLIAELLAAYPDHDILLSHMTPTGRATGKELFAAQASRVRQSYLPYDTGWMTARFLRHFKPLLCVLMETEVWPNLIAQCTKHGVPVALVNARLSERSLRRAGRFGRLMSDAAQGITVVAAQSEADETRIRQLGVEAVQVTGSIKFDVTPPSAVVARGLEMREQIGPRPVLLCASTRDGEEALILDALEQFDLKDTLLILVPRHPQRFDEVARMIEDRRLAMRRRSTMGKTPLELNVQILLGDSMGEMFAYYAACDIAFIGGSLLPMGGQNLIEACALGKPVLIGPHTFNFSAATDDAIEAGAALRVKDAVEMVEQAMRLLQDREKQIDMGTKAQAFAQRHRGATERTLALIRPVIDAKSGS